MNRRRGFTLIEVLATVMISVATLVMAVHFGHKWWQYQHEVQFLTAFETHWNAMMQDAQAAQGEFTAVALMYHAQTQTLEFRRGALYATSRQRLTIPTGMRLVINDSDSNDVQRNQQSVGWTFAAGEHFSELRTLTFTRANGRKVRFTTQLGWGVLIRQDE